MTFKKAKDPRTVLRRIRMKPAEDAQVRELAKAAGVTVSDYMRGRALGSEMRPKVDAQAINELRRLGGLVKHLHTSSGGAYSAQTAEALAELKAAILRVGA